MTISENDEARLGEWLGVDVPDDRVPLVTVGEARAVVLLLQQLADSEGAVGWAARDVAGRIARRLPGGD
ncbi:hypothetical protein DMB38_12885 [Streptomyces sp. WAC 06738]|nr:hypothetical protein DMB38_12885 [Streptomyces sp. WAC 06738]